jgi:hypothetical protein
VSIRLVTLVIKLCLCIAIQLSAWADTQESRGFYRPSDPKVPQAIRKATKSVFEIYSLAPIPQATLNLRVLDAKYVNDQLRLHFEEDMKAGLLPANPKILEIRLDQVKQCRAHKQLEACEIHAVLSQGSGFLMGDGHSLWTAYHNIEALTSGIAEKNSLKVWEVFESLEKVNLPIYVFDSKGGLVFSTLFESNAHVVVKPFDHHGLRDKEDASYRTSSDFAKINLSKPLGPPLVLAKQKSKPGDPTYLAGYPSATGPGRWMKEDDSERLLFSRAPAPDSDGLGLRVSIGESLSRIEGLNRKSKSDDTYDASDVEWMISRAISQSKIDFDDLLQILYATNDTVHGSSGGPLLNARGEVLALSAYAGARMEEETDRVTFLTSICVDLLKVDERLKANPALIYR